LGFGASSDATPTTQAATIPLLPVIESLHRMPRPAGNHLPRIYIARREVFLVRSIAQRFAEYSWKEKEVWFAGYLLAWPFSWLYGSAQSCLVETRSLSFSR
jgi:hypothetical protein